MKNFFKKIKKNRGFTYVELIVVLSIFAVMTSVVMFNYNSFQANIDIKSLANDVALQIVQAQKDAMNGKLVDKPFTDINNTDGTGKPSYGVYFNLSSKVDNSDNIAFNKKFIYFADLNNDGLYNYPGNDALISKINITKGNSIKSVMVFGVEYSTSGVGVGSGKAALIFKRPNSGVILRDSNTAQSVNYEHLEIKIVSSDEKVSSCIYVYPSGRVQINQCTK